MNRMFITYKIAAYSVGNYNISTAECIYKFLHFCNKNRLLRSTVFCVLFLLTFHLTLLSLFRIFVSEPQSLLFTLSLFP